MLEDVKIDWQTRRISFKNLFVSGNYSIGFLLKFIFQKEKPRLLERGFF